jgi:hypothetical protein
VSRTVSALAAPGKGPVSTGTRTDTVPAALHVGSTPGALGEAALRERLAAS